MEWNREKMEDIKIGGATLEVIYYYFWRGKFESVLIYTKGFVNFDNLKQAVFEKFGKGYQHQPEKNIEEYGWLGKNTDMILRYDKSSEIGYLFMHSKKIAQQQEEYQKQKAKEGAEKGF